MTDLTLGMNKFDQRVQEILKTKGTNGRAVTKDSYENGLEILKTIEMRKWKKTLSELNLMRKAEIMRFSEPDGTIVEKLVKPGTNLRIICLEDMFYTIHEKHLLLNYAGRKIMQKKMREKYANVTTEFISLQVCIIMKVL